jgi:hypothetical protein
MTITLQDIERRISVAERAARAISLPKHERNQLVTYFCDHPRIRFHGFTKVETDHRKRRFVQLSVLNTGAITIPQPLQSRNIVLTLNASSPIELSKYVFIVNGRIADAVILDAQKADEGLTRIQLTTMRHYGRRTTIYIGFNTGTTSYAVDIEPQEDRLDLYLIAFIPEPS